MILNMQLLAKFAGGGMWGLLTIDGWLAEITPAQRKELDVLNYEKFQK